MAGRTRASVGYQSRDGRIYYANRHIANTYGTTYKQGECVVV